jgi:hypothetical protein
MSLFGRIFGTPRAVIRQRSVAMILSEVDSVVQERCPAKNCSRPEEEFKVSRGDFVAVVLPHENQYSFFVRDLRRERPTIHGFGVDFPHAVIAVTQLLDALTDGR